MAILQGFLKIILIFYDFQPLMFCMNGKNVVL